MNKMVIRAAYYVLAKRAWLRLGCIAGKGNIAILVDNLLCQHFKYIKVDYLINLKITTLKNLIHKLK